MCEDVVPTGWADEISCQLQAIAGIVEHWIADYLLVSQPRAELFGRHYQVEIQVSPSSHPGHWIQ
jgi:hypothetical protein